MHEILVESFELLGDEIILGDARIWARRRGGDIPAGSGKLDYDLYLGIPEAQVDGPLDHSRPGRVAGRRLRRVLADKLTV